MSAPDWGDVPGWIAMVMAGGALYIQWRQHRERGPGPGPNVNIQIMGYLKLSNSLTANIDVINSGDAPATLWNFHVRASDAHVYPMDIQRPEGVDASVVIPAHERTHLALRVTPHGSARDAHAKVGSPPVLKVHTSYRHEPIVIPIPPRLVALSDRLEADSAATAQRLAEARRQDVGET